MKLKDHFKAFSKQVDKFHSLNDLLLNGVCSDFFSPSFKLMVIYFKRTYVAISDNIGEGGNKQIKILLFVILDGIKLKAANMLSICQMESSS